MRTRPRLSDCVAKVHNVRWTLVLDGPKRSEDRGEVRSTRPARKGYYGFEREYEPEGSTVLSWTSDVSLSNCSVGIVGVWNKEPKVSYRYFIRGSV